LAAGHGIKRLTKKRAPQASRSGQGCPIRLATNAEEITLDSVRRNIGTAREHTVMKLQLLPSIPKLLIPILLAVGAVSPIYCVRFPFDQIMFLSFPQFFWVPPFAYQDKLFLVTPVGGFVAAIVWGSLIYLLSSIKGDKGPKVKSSFKTLH
jgi:hypothetical protein